MNMSDQEIRPVVIFRYHDHFDVVKQRVAWLKKLNPTVPIYGMYGGEVPVSREVAELFVDNHMLTLSKEHAWMNLDLAVLEWYRAMGKDVDFTHAYVVEWDLIFTQPLNEVMPVPKIGQSLLTGYIPLALVEHRWSWTDGSQPKKLKDWLEFKRDVAERLDFFGPYYACLGPGAVLSREFFEFYDSLDLPPGCHDELRLPMVHSMAGLSVESTNLYPKHWHGPEREEWLKRFNCMKDEVTPERLYEYVKAGHTFFHPVYSLLDESKLR